jgi:SAM-dependent methyltransferase
MLAEAQRLHPELAGRLYAGSLPGPLPEIAEAPFDNILLSAVLMHIPDGDLFSTALAIRSLLKPDGQLVISIPTERDDLPGGTDRDESGRLMMLRSEAAVSLLFERLGFQKTASWHSADLLSRNGVNGSPYSSDTPRRVLPGRWSASSPSSIPTRKPPPTSWHYFEPAATSPRGRVAVCPGILTAGCGCR